MLKKCVLNYQRVFLTLFYNYDASPINKVIIGKWRIYDSNLSRYNVRKWIDFYNSRVIKVSVRINCHIYNVKVKEIAIVHNVIIVEVFKDQEVGFTFDHFHIFDKWM